MKPLNSFKNSEPTYQDKDAIVINGFAGLLFHLFLVFLLILLGLSEPHYMGEFRGINIINEIIMTFPWFADMGSTLRFSLATILFVISFVYLSSYVIVQPNEAIVTQFFGKYSSTLKTEGFQFFINPFYSTTRVSLRINNFESNKLKVNDVNANPVDIAAVVVWRVFDAAEALFEVEDFRDYVQIQSEAALREMATKYPYDAIEQKDIGGITLSSHQDAVAEELQTSVEARLARAGIEVLEARISYLAYSTEIAQAMLRRQQAAAVVAARREIVDGAVGMVELALEQLSTKNIIELNEDKKATMVSNLLVVLCSETDTTPVVNTGSLNS